MSLCISDYASKYPYAEVTSVGSGFFDGKWYFVVCFNEDGKEYKYIISPEKFGITDADAEELNGGDGVENAGLAMDVLNGKGRKTILYAVCMNAGAVLYISGKARTLKDGYDMAMDAIKSGKVKSKLEQIVEVSKSLA